MAEKIKVKLNKEKENNWTILLEVLINNGYSFWVDENDVYLYLKNEDGWALKLTKNGNWDIE